jgi:hypothetical protein
VFVASVARKTSPGVASVVLSRRVTVTVPTKPMSGSGETWAATTAAEPFGKS